MGDLIVRAAAAQDAEFLADMLVEAANAPRFERERAELLANPEVAGYLDGWPRTTDLGVVAVDDAPAGAAWLRFFTADAPAFGFVRADIPELAIGVEAARRGRGVGRLLLRALHEAARQQGIRQISLSVDRANPAARLYLAEGYRVVHHRENSDTMLLDLA
ncbi:MAG TPA: GNAT family N-acetyltransferase [Pseudonocardiaceae bacterium]|nr:GNAT family N-acetyltransferase [Pseudonocardiaceae bacterium]